jgi:hypothetical protein
VLNNGLIEYLIITISYYTILASCHDNKNYHDGQYLTTGKIIPSILFLEDE